MEGLEAESAVFSVPKDLKVACKVRYEAVIFSDFALKVMLMPVIIFLGRLL